MRHITQILLTESLILLQSGNLLVVVVSPGGKLLRDVLDVLILHLIDNLGSVHIAREHHRVYGFKFVGNILLHHKEREE